MEVKKFKNEVYVILVVFAEVFLVEFGWSKLFTVFQRCLGLVQESSVSEKCFFRELFYEDVHATTGHSVVESVSFILGAAPDSFQYPSIAFRFLSLH